MRKRILIGIELYKEMMDKGMLKTFFEDERDCHGAGMDNLPYFEGKKIASCGWEYMEKKRQYPVISLTLKFMHFRSLTGRIFPPAA